MFLGHTQNMQDNAPALPISKAGALQLEWVPRATLFSSPLLLACYDAENGFPHRD